MKKFLKRFRNINNKIASNVTLVMGTMWAAYFLLLWSLLPILFPSIQELVFYVSGGIIQLVALPLIMVGQSVLSKSSERRAQQDHKMIIEQFNTLKHIQEVNQRKMKLLCEILEHIENVRVLDLKDDVKVKITLSPASKGKIQLD